MSRIITIPQRFHFDPAPLRVAIAKQRLKQRAIAGTLGIHYVTLSRLLGGEVQSRNALYKVVAYLGVPIGEVLQPIDLQSETQEEITA